MSYNFNTLADQQLQRRLLQSRVHPLDKSQLYPPNPTGSTLSEQDKYAEMLTEYMSNYGERDAEIRRRVIVPDELFDGWGYDASMLDTESESIKRNVKTLLRRNFWNYYVAKYKLYLLKINFVTQNLLHVIIFALIFAVVFAMLTKK